MQTTRAGPVAHAGTAASEAQPAPAPGATHSLTPAVANGSCPRVLVIEHDRAIRTMQALILGDAGYAVLEASNGYSGLRVARTHRPQAIVLETVLPELSGWRLVEALRTDPLTANVPLVVVSAYTDRIDPRVLGLVHAIVCKPFSVADLLTAVGGVLGSVR